MWLSVSALEELLWWWAVRLALPYEEPLSAASLETQFDKSREMQSWARWRAARWVKMSSQWR